MNLATIDRGVEILMYDILHAIIYINKPNLIEFTSFDPSPVHLYIASFVYQREQTLPKVTFPLLVGEFFFFWGGRLWNA